MYSKHESIIDRSTHDCGAVHRRSNNLLHESKAMTPNAKIDTSHAFRSLIKPNAVPYIFVFYSAFDFVLGADETFVHEPMGGNKTMQLLR